jgi:hypothetical protein
MKEDDVMVSVRMIWMVLLASAVTALRTEESTVQVGEAFFTKGPECDSAADCASAVLAQADEGPTIPAPAGCHVNDFWSIDVSGLYTVTATGVLMPGTEGTLRVIEFSRPGENDSKP